MATEMTSGDAPRGGAGGRVAARFDGANQSETALRELQGAGFRADQVAAEVYNPQTDGAAGGLTAGMVPILGAVLGAILGGVLGLAFVGSTTAIVLGAIVGAVAGALIALAVARAGAASAASAAPPQRPGSVTLTVTADSAEQLRAARAALTGHGGQELPSGGGR